jgi:hypothetical protein
MLHHPLHLVKADYPPSILQEQVGISRGLGFDWYIAQNCGAFGEKRHLIGCSCFLLLVS